MKNHKKKFAVPVLTFLALFMSLGASAQMNHAWTAYDLNVLGAGRMANVLTTVRDAMEETNTPLYFLAAESVSGNPQMAVLVSHESYGFMDVAWGQALQNHLSEEELITLGADMQAAVAHMSTERYRGRPDLGRMPENPMNQGVPDAVVTIRLDVVLGKEVQFENWMKQVIEATDATAPNAYWETWSPVFSTDDYMVIYTMPEWELFDEPGKSVRQRVLEHFGERRGERMLEESSAWLNGMETTLYRTRLDLSRPPPQ